MARLLYNCKFVPFVPLHLSLHLLPSMAGPSGPLSAVSSSSVSPSLLLFGFACSFVLLFTALSPFFLVACLQWCLIIYSAAFKKCHRAPLLWMPLPLLLVSGPFLISSSTMKVVRWVTRLSFSKAREVLSSAVARLLKHLMRTMEDLISFVVLCSLDLR